MMGHGSTLHTFNWVFSHAAAGTGPVFDLCCVWPFTDALMADQRLHPQDHHRLLRELHSDLHDDSGSDDMLSKSGKTTAWSRSCIPTLLA